jgi:hypothetical protein
MNKSEPILRPCLYSAEIVLWRRFVLGQQGDGHALDRDGQARRRPIGRGRLHDRDQHIGMLARIIGTSIHNNSGLPQGPPNLPQAGDASNRLRPAVPSWYDRRRHPWEGASCSASGGASS